MTRFPRAPLLALLFAAAPVHAVGLPDTGQDICYNDTTADTVAASSPASIARDAGTHPRQDCRFGRDVAVAAGALSKIGAGAKGFDYTKIANNGATLDAAATLGTAATDWACTRDNITGLTWEVKTATVTDPRYFGHTYNWYNTDTSTNGGNAGSTGGNTCGGTLQGNLCNTQAFVAAVNAAALCSYADWRMPTVRELFTLVSADNATLTIDSTYFPNTSAASSFWTSSSYVAGLDLAWNVSFHIGNTPTSSKLSTSRNFVRLVRGGQF